ncbi:hypothetical protein D3C81_1275990 [compost metagenome]
MHLAVRPQRAAGMGHAVADLEPGHTLAHRLDHARSFSTQARRQGRRRIQPAAEVGIDEVQADCMVTHTHLLWAERGRGEFHQLQYFRAAMLSELDTLCHHTLL